MQIKVSQDINIARVKGCTVFQDVHIRNERFSATNTLIRLHSSSSVGTGQRGFLSGH